MKLWETICDPGGFLYRQTPSIQQQDLWNFKVCTVPCDYESVSVRTSTQQLHVKFSESFARMNLSSNSD